MIVTVILKVLTSLEALAAECLETFGEGARPEFSEEICAFALNNTPLQNGYIRIPCLPHIAAALQWMLDNNITSPNAEIIAVEWEGQQDFITGYTVAQSLEDGSFIPEQPIYLGRMGT